MEKDAGSKSPQCKMKESSKLIITLAILLGICGIFILHLSMPLMGAKTIILQTRPIDPFDALRGQYITIRYEISTIPYIEDARTGDSVYVLLKEDKDKIFRFESASLKKPSGGDFIRGTIKYMYGSTMEVEYGIEQYFFERNAELPRTQLQVQARIGSSGQARIVQLMKDGKPVELNYTNAGS
jgi:uncharacterized membrane-anchored protein